MIPNITNDVIEHIAPREVILQAWNNMVNGIRYATKDSARARMARRSWFGKTMESSPELQGNLNALLNFVDSNEPLSISFDKNRNIPSAIAYTILHCIGAPLNIHTIYLTKKFTTIEPNERVKYLMKNRNTQGVQIIALAHELSHLVIGTNRKNPDFLTEKYAQEAMYLRDRNPIYALNNADNYGYCIEMCS